MADNINRIWSLSQKKREEILLANYPSAANLSKAHRLPLLTNPGIQAVWEGLITVDQIVTLDLYPALLEYLLVENGIQAIREELISVKEIAELGLKPAQLGALLGSESGGLEALRNQAITLKAIKEKNMSAMEIEEAIRKKPRQQM